MQSQSSFFFVLLFLTSLCLGTGCDAPRDEPDVTAAENRVEEEFMELQAWAYEKTEQIDSATQEEWPEIKAEFKRRSARIDARFDSLTQESKAEYKELRRKFNNWEAQTQQRAELPLYAETLRRFKVELLGSPTALDSIWPPTEVSQKYALFLENVRNKRSGWSPSDWDYVDEIYQQMNNKKDAVEREIPAGDKLKIKALQAEFLTLETGNDAKTLFKAVK